MASNTDRCEWPECDNDRDPDSELYCAFHELWMRDSTDYTLDRAFHNPDKTIRQLLGKG